MPSLWAPAVALAIALAAAHRLSLAHQALAGISRARLRSLAEDGSRRAGRLAALLAHRDVAQASLRLGYDVALLVCVGIIWWMAVLAEPWLGRGALLLALGGLLGVGFVGELLPRLVAAAAPEVAVLRYTRWIEALYHLAGPLLRALLEPRDPPRDEPDDEHAEDSIRELVDTTPLQATRRRRISEILEFPDRTAAEVMVPRIDMIGVSAEAPLSEVSRAIVESGFSRLPVYGESRDDIVGIIYARDVLRHLPDNTAAAAVAREPLFVSETMRLDHLLRELRMNQNSMAIVVDEYGGTAGMVTVEDVVEEIVGEIHDETDTATPQVRRRAEGGWVVPARMELSDLEDLLGEELEIDEAADYSTLGGLVLELAGDMPAVGQVVVQPLPDALLAVMVLAVEGTRLGDLAVILRPRDEGEEETAGDPVNEVSETLTVTGDERLARIDRVLGYDRPAGEGASAGDLLAFWPAGRRSGHEVRWRSHRVRVVDETDDGVVLRFEI